MKDNKEKIMLSVNKIAEIESKVRHTVLMNTQFYTNFLRNQKIYKSYAIFMALRKLSISALEAEDKPHLFERVYYEIQQTEEKYKAAVKHKAEQKPEVFTDNRLSFTVRLKKALYILINKTK